MKRYACLYTLMLMYACTSCAQSPAEFSTDNIKAEQKRVSPLSKADQKLIYSTYEYADSTGARVVIQNSVPKSGIKYTGPDGKKYVYAVFWTRVINQTANPVKLTIDLPADPFEFPLSSGNHMELLLPADTLTANKESRYDHGLAVKPFLDANIHRAFSLKRTVGPKSSSGFYVLTLSDHGVGGTLRTELFIKGQDLIYRVNGKEIQCGKISSNQLSLQTK